MRKLLRRLAWLLLSLAALYLVVINALLNTALGPQLINRQPGKFQMHWAQGLSLYPGHVRLWSVQFKGHVRRIAWSAQASEVSARIALPALLRRELHVPSLWAQELEGDIDLAPLLPPMPREDDAWSLRFDRISTDSLRRVRWGQHTLTMHGQGQFGFFKQLRGGAFEIFPSQVSLRQTRWRQGATDWLQGADMTVHGALPRHTREQASGWQRLALADVQVQLNGRLPALAVRMDPTLRWDGEVRNDGSGSLRLALALKHAQLQPGGVVELNLPLHARDADGREWQQAARLQLDVDQDLRLRVALPPPPAGRGKVEADLRIAGTALPLTADSEALLRRLSGSVALQWQFDSLAWLGPLLARTPWLQLEGAGELDANLIIAAGQLTAGSRLQIPAVDLIAEVQGQRISGRAKADGRIDTQQGELKPRVDIAVAAFRVATLATPQQIIVRGRDLRLELQASGRVAAFRDSLQARLRFERAEIPDLRVYNSYLPGRALRFRGGRGLLSGDLRLDAAGDVGKGRLRVQAQSAELAANDLEFSGDVDLDAQLDHADLASNRFVLDGTRLKLQRVRISDPERASPGDWWADIVFTRGRLHWGQPFLVEADATLRMRNVGLLLALFTRHKDYPRWVLRLLDAGEAQASARAQMKGTAVTLDDVAISNDRFDLKARLRLAERRAQGDLYLRWAKLGLGLELREEGRKFHLLKAADWYAQQPRLLAPAGQAASP